MLVILIIFIILIIYILSVYNKVIKQENAVKNAKSIIDVYLMQRFDLIPNLVKCVKEYTNYEEEILEKITKLRTEYVKEKELAKAGILDTEVNKIMIILENYPNLKASEQFLNLQKNLTKMENQIQAARRIYNHEVEKYNNTIGIFPNNLIARILNFTRKEFFEMEE